MLEVYDKLFTNEDIIELHRYSNSVAFFETYFDESGTHDDSLVTCVGGISAKRSSWISICNQWGCVLKKYNVKAYHASDLNVRKGEFLGWDEDKRKSFVSKLLKIIKSEGNLFGMGCVISRELFNEVSEKFPNVPLSPYTLCVEYACIIAGCTAMGKKQWSPMAIVFEDGLKHKTPTIDHTLRLLRKPQFKKDYKIQSITWQQKEGVIPFQLADMYAYELYKRADSLIKHGKDANIRYILKRLNDDVENYGIILDGEKAVEYYDISDKYMSGNLSNPF